MKLLGKGSERVNTLIVLYFYISFFPLQDEMRAPDESPPSFRAAPYNTQNLVTRENHLNLKPSARLVQPASGLLFTGLTRLQQDCPHKSPTHVSATHSPHTSSGQHPCAGARHHTSLNALHHTCQSSSQLSDHPHFPQHIHHHAAHQNRPSSGHRTCPGFLHHRDSSPSARREALAKFSSRSSSYEKSSATSKSASSSKAASPMPSPHLSPHPSPCPSPCPSLIAPAASSCSPDRSCSPALSQKITVTDMNRLSAESRQPQRGIQLM